MTDIQKFLLGKLPTGFCLSNIKAIAAPLCLGDPKDMADGCWARFYRAIEHLDPETSLVIQTGGTEELQLCQIMKTKLPFQAPEWMRGFLCPVMGWGTRSEIKNLFMIIRQLDRQALDYEGINTEAPDFKVVISSNRLHLWRIRWFVYLYNIDRLSVEYRVAHHPFSLWSKARECATPLVVLKDAIFKGVKNLREEAIKSLYNLPV